MEYSVPNIPQIYLHKQIRLSIHPISQVKETEVQRLYSLSKVIHLESRRNESNPDVLIPSLLFLIHYSFLLNTLVPHPPLSHRFYDYKLTRTHINHFSSKILLSWVTTLRRALICI